jgi:hypothetical protein
MDRSSYRPGTAEIVRLNDVSAGYDGRAVLHGMNLTVIAG